MSEGAVLLCHRGCRPDSLRIHPHERDTVINIVCTLHFELVSSINPIAIYCLA